MMIQPGNIVTEHTTSKPCLHTDSLILHAAI
uniref:Uncharacterized protein n=1 Tax=Anguilla anguilla TaxID=7936 RepID=A0A0E9TCR7_ANGAN